MIAKIFISYRRNDNRWAAQRICEDLSKRYDPVNVFKDHSIEGGQDFENRLKTELTSCNILVVVIGDRWIGEMKIRRKKGQIDYVVEEIAQALREGKKIIPVLLDDSKMPDENVLPDEIKQIKKVKAETIKVESYGKDINILFYLIDKFLLEKQNAKRVLVIDGLSVRGIVALRILETLEEHLNIYSAKENGRLSNHFDLIISTGPMSIIAALLAMGKSVQEAKEFYKREKDFFLTTTPDGKSRLLNNFVSYDLPDNFKSNIRIDFVNKKMTRESFDTEFCLFLFDVKERRTVSISSFESLNKKYSKFPVSELMLAACSIPYVNCTNPFCIKEENYYYSGVIGTTNIPTLRSLQFLIAYGEKLKWQIDEDSLLMVSVGTGFFEGELPVKEKVRLMKLANLLPEMIMQSASDTNNRIIKEITHSLDKTPLLDNSEEMVRITLAQEKKFGTYLRLDVNLTKVDGNLTHKSDYITLKRSLKIKQDLVSTDVLKSWFSLNKQI